MGSTPVAVCNDFEINDLGEYYELYVQNNILLLTCGEDCDKY